MTAPPPVAIVGLGLIGGSLARALSRGGWDVAGVERRSVPREARRALTTTYRDAREAADDGRMVVLAAPPAANLALLRALEGTDALITDVGSVKHAICAEAERLQLRRFVGGHPMAGTAGQGFTAGNAELFVGRTWIVMPSRHAGAVRRMARAVGARPVTLDAAAHDRAMAFLSHVPQVVAWALHEAAGNEPAARRALAGPGFQAMTRLAASPRALWREILEQNGPEVARAIEAFRDALDRTAETMGVPRGRPGKTRKAGKR